MNPAALPSKMLIAAGDEQQLEICIALPYVAHDNAHFNHLLFKVMLQCISKGSVFCCCLPFFLLVLFFFNLSAVSEDLGSLL